jgi:predicted nucleic acid-binding protein
VKRLFLDANVLFTAAHNPAGKAALVIESAAPGQWGVITSRLAVEEARRNLERKYPSCSSHLEQLLSDIEVFNGSDGTKCPIELPSKDRPIFEAAMMVGASHLLTGDTKHFGSFMNKPEETFGIHVQTVSDFLSEL